jgi:hypothetical protein
VIFMTGAQCSARKGSALTRRNGWWGQLLEELLDHLMA